MRIMRGLSGLAVSLFFLILSGCVSLGEETLKDQKFKNMFTDTPISGYFKISILDNAEIVGNKLIVVENISDVVVEIPEIADQLYIYGETEKEWITIPEKMTSEEPFRLYPREDIESAQMNSWVIVIDPDLRGFERPIKVRAIFIGEIIENGNNTGKKVGGFIDLEYK